MQPTVHDAAGVPRSATGSWAVATPVTGPPAAFEARLQLRFALPSPTDRVVVDPAATRLAGSFAHASQTIAGSALRVDAGAVIVELAAPREIVAVQLSASSPADQVALFRLDRDVRSEKATAVADLTGRTATFSGFRDVRFAVELRKGGVPQTAVTGAIAGITVRSEPSTPRLGVALAGLLPDADFLVLDGTTLTDAGPALAEALTALLAGPGVPPSRADLVVRSDAPCTLSIGDFAVTARLEAATFAYGELTPADLADAPALVAALRLSRDPVSEHLRAALPAPLRSALHAADGAPGRALVRDLLTAFGTVLRAAPLYDATRFAGVELSGSTLARLDPAAAGDARTALNRLLLQDAYPGTILDPGDRRVLRDLADPAAAGELLVELPAGARPAEADLRTTETLRPDRAAPGGGLLGAGSAGERRAGHHVAAGTAVAAAFELGAPVTATGIALAALALAPGVVLDVEVQEDWRGLPSGRALVAGSVALGAAGEPAIVSAAAEPATIATGTHWAVVRCRAGAAVWLAAPAGAGTRTARDAGDGWVAGAALPGLALPIDLLARTAAGAEAAAATALRVGGAVVPAARDGDRATYALAAALTVALAGAPAGLVRVPMTFTTTVPGTVAVSPPRIVYDL